MIGEPIEGDLRRHGDRALHLGDEGHAPEAASKNRRSQARRAFIATPAAPARLRRRCRRAPTATRSPGSTPLATRTLPVVGDQLDRAVVHAVARVDHRDERLRRRASPAPRPAPRPARLRDASAHLDEAAGHDAPSGLSRSTSTSIMRVRGIELARDRASPAPARGPRARARRSPPRRPRARRGVALIDVDVDAQRVALRDGHQRQRAGLRVGALCTSAPGSAKRAVTMPSNGARSTSYALRAPALRHLRLGHLRRRPARRSPRPATDTTPGWPARRARRALRACCRRRPRAACVLPVDLGRLDDREHLVRLDRGRPCRRASRAGSRVTLA